VVNIGTSLLKSFHSSIWNRGIEDSIKVAPEMFPCSPQLTRDVQFY
jgi:hypothetical protein